MPRRRLGGISSRSSHSLNSGYEAALAAESVEAKPEPESVEAKPEPEPESVEAKPEPEPESVEAKPEPESTPQVEEEGVIELSSVDDIDVDK